MRVRKNKLAVTVVVLSVVFLALISWSFKSSQENIISNGAGAALNPIQKITYTINSKIKGFVDLCLNFTEVKDQNVQLEAENAQLKNQLLQYSGLEAQNDQLRKVLNFETENSEYNYIATHIIGYSGGNILDGYIIDKGTDSGIKKGYVVIAPNGLVGQVTSVGSNWATVQSILNENIAVAVKVQNTNDNTGILRGVRQNQTTANAEVENIAMDSNIKAGDTIVTSGLGGIYPQNILIGTVQSVSTDNVNIMKTAIIKPAVNFNQIDSLFVVAPKNTRDINYNS
ncbi:rod shape-determining protein MreC [uncultured Clostridium sp.]|uniref:rod shape-determining protein MreC n=1 Tax=uncultured Clostridium sp. TaxID=59620 RepID=UPI0026283C8C|nr:rod shape-determining protein MreC [uncultured Clostridium sp.]